MLVADLARGKGEVGQLHQQEATEKVIGDAVIANQSGTQYRYGRGDQSPGVETTVQCIVDQCHVERRQYREQQHFRHRQHVETQIQAEVGDAELQRADQCYAADEARCHAAPAGQREEYHACQQHACQHSEVAVHLASEVGTDQVEGKRPEQGDENQVAHADSSEGRRP